MGSVTYFAVLPFVKDDEGQLCADQAVECRSSTAAASRARTRAAAKAGAVAFSRTGDPETGDWAEAVVLLRVGETPADLEAVSG